MARVRLPPFQIEDQLIPNLLPSQLATANIPNEPGVQSVRTKVEDFLARELETPLLDQLYDYLWLVAKKSGSHVSSLHEQVIKQQTITIAEDPKLHLVWNYHIIYLKPIPHCLLNHDFWNDYLVPRPPFPGQDTYDVNKLSPACLRALGFLRTYGFLIQHESDFILAQDAHLVPKTIQYTDFVRFILGFRYLTDELVAKRYHYGQFRLTRLNYAVRILRPSSAGRIMPWNYEKRYWQTGQFLGSLAAPLIFTFAALSLVLSSMQVVFNARGPNTWPSFSRFSSGFSIAVIVVVAVLVAGVLLGVVCMLIVQAQFAIRKRREEKEDQHFKKSGHP